MDDLRDDLLNTLRDSGTVNTLKAQLRSQVIGKLRKKEKIFTEFNFESLDKRLLCSVVADALLRYKFMYTLSVFLPEGGFDMDELLSREECARVLRLDHGKENCENKDDDFRKPLLIELFKSPQSLVQKDSGTQTFDGDNFQGDTATTVLERKLDRVQGHYSMLIEQETLAPRRSMEERIIKYQHECDKRADDTIKSEVERFMAMEFEHLKRRERSLMQRELHKYKDTMHREYQGRLASLAKREALLDDQLRRRQNELEADLHEQRDLLIRQMESLGSKSKLESSYLDIERRELQQSRHQIERAQLEINKNEIEIKRVESELRSKYADDVRCFRQSVLADFADRERDLSKEEYRVKQKSQQVQQQVEQFASNLQEANEMKPTVDSISAKLADTEKANHEFKVKCEFLESKVAFLQQAHSTELQKNDKINLEFNRLRKDWLSQVSDSPELKSKDDSSTNLMEVISALKNGRRDDADTFEQRVLQMEKHYKQKIVNLQDRLDCAEQELDRAVSENEILNSNIKSTKDENIEIRKLLKQARKALDEEISDKDENKLNYTPYTKPPSHQMSEQIAHLQQQLIGMRMQMMQAPYEQMYFHGMHKPNEESWIPQRTNEHRQNSSNSSDAKNVAGVSDSIPDSKLELVRVEKNSNAREDPGGEVKILAIGASSAVTNLAVTSPVATIDERRIVSTPVASIPVVTVDESSDVTNPSASIPVVTVDESSDVTNPSASIPVVPVDESSDVTNPSASIPVAPVDESSAVTNLVATTDESLSVANPVLTYPVATVDAPTVIIDKPVVIDSHKEEEEEMLQVEKLREAQDRQRKLQQQRQKERQRNILEQERLLREQEELTEKAKLDEERLESMEAEKRRKEAEEKLKDQAQAEEREKNIENDKVIEMYRQKAKEKLAQETQTVSESDAASVSSDHSISVGENASSSQSDDWGKF